MAETVIAKGIGAGRLLGTMIVFGFLDRDADVDLALAGRIGASVVEILPDWSRLPDPALVRERVAARGMLIHSAHACWGSRTIRAARVDLGAVDVATHRESVDDLKRCADWLDQAGGRCLVVHPGGLSVPEDRDSRRAALARGLCELAEHVHGTKIVLCVENMPPGVYPGSSMAELAELLAELNDPALALAVDTGHANLRSTAAAETLAAGPLLATTHVHDNNGRQDSHEPPGHGTIDWVDWGRALDATGYDGPIMLECIRRLREEPESYRPEALAGLVRTPIPGAAAATRY
jgi:sugar phosphate isomerase/epimerase